MIAHTEMITRIVVGAALGGVIGFERDRHHRPVGLRTHLIVAMAAATFMVISTQAVYFQHYGKEDLVNIDGSRIAASIVSGIGFLAGGAILRTGLNIQGLTTAAGLWLVTAIGMSAGGGMYLESVVVTAMGIAALTVFRRFEDKDDRQIHRRISVVLGDDAEAIDGVVAGLRALGAVVSDVEYERRLEEAKRRTRLTLDVKFPDSVGIPALIAAVEAVRGVQRIHVQHRL